MFTSPLFCRRLKRLFAALLALALLTLGVFAVGGFRDGVYYGMAMGRNGWISVSVSVAGGKIAAVDVDGPQETPAKLGQALAVAEAMRGLGDLESVQAVDTISGATMSSEGIKNAVLNALQNAKASWLHGEDESCPGAAFADLPAYGSWAHTPIDWAVSADVVQGTGKTTVSPDAVCNRAQAVTFLWRAAGSPVILSDSEESSEFICGDGPCLSADGRGSSLRDHSGAAFSDVPEDAYYADAVRWAVGRGITKGTGETTFSPNAPCTRAQVATFLWRAAGSPDLSPQAPQNDTAEAFSDVSPSAYYADAVCWAVQNGIAQGVGNGRFRPDAPCTRAQIVTFLYRWDGQ